MCTRHLRFIISTSVFIHIIQIKMKNDENCPNSNDTCTTNANETRAPANDTRSIFNAFNPLKRRVSFRDMPNIHEFELTSRPSSSAGPSPLPSGFLDTTHTIFKSLAAQTPTKLLKVDEVAKNGSVDEQLDKTHVIQHTPFHERLLAYNANNSDKVADLVFDEQTPHKRGGESLLFTPRVQAAEDGAGDEHLNKTHVIQHTPFQDRLLAHTADNSDESVFNEQTSHKRGGESPLFTPRFLAAEDGAGDEQLTMNQTHAVQNTHNQLRDRLQSLNVSNITGTMLLNDLTKHRGGSSLLFGSQDNYGFDELSVDARSMSIDDQQQQAPAASAPPPDNSSGPSSLSSVGAATMMTETPKSSHQLTITKTTVAVDFEYNRMSETAQQPPPTVQIPMGHLNDAEFDQWHEAEMESEIDKYDEALQNYMDKNTRLHEKKKLLMGRVDAVKERITKFRAEFGEAEQQHEEKRRALLRSMENC